MDAHSEAPERSAPILAAVLAGGKSSRMGRPKATLELAGRPLIAYPLAALEAAGIETVVVAKPGSELPRLRVPVWTEPVAPAHPLCGVVAGLRRAGRPLLVVGCDLPFITAALLLWLSEVPGELVVPSAAGRLQPLLARYGSSLLPALALALERGEPMQRTLTALGPQLVGQDEIARFGPPERLLFNVNTLHELSEAERMLGG